MKIIIGIIINTELDIFFLSKYHKIPLSAFLIIMSIILDPYLSGCESFATVALAIHSLIPGKIFGTK